MTFDEVWAVPGKDHIIDVIDPGTGRTRTCGKDADEVLRNDPNAVRMTWEAWQTAAAERQNQPIRWLRSDEHTYRDMLEVLPPAFWRGGAFLVGEPTDHCFRTGAPRFAAYWTRNGIYLVASRPLTVAEIRAEMARA